MRQLAKKSRTTALIVRPIPGYPTDLLPHAPYERAIGLAAQLGVLILRQVHEDIRDAARGEPLDHGEPAPAGKRGQSGVEDAESVRAAVLLERIGADVRELVYRTIGQGHRGADRLEEGYP